MYVCVRAYVRVCESFTDTGLSGVYPVSCLPWGQEFTKVCVCVCVCVWLGPSVAMVTVTGIRPDAGLVQIVEESVQCFSTWCVI